MKKYLAAILAGMLCLTSMAGLTGCTKEPVKQGPKDKGE